MSRAERAATADRLRQDPERDDGQLRLPGLVVRAAVLALIVIAVAASVVVQRSRDVNPASYGGPYAPVTFHGAGTVVMAQPGVTRPVVNVYEDFQCPVCQEFEAANGGVLQQLADRGEVRVIYHVFTIFLGSQPRQSNSTRAWAATRCVPADSWLRYHNLLYASQPSELTAGGFPVSQLLTLGKRIGLSSRAFTRCVSAQRYAPEIVPLSQRIIRGGVNATPNVFLNGQHVSVGVLATPGTTFRQMILAAH